MTKGILDEIFDLPMYDEDVTIIKEAPDDEEPSGGGDAPADDVGNDDNAEDAPQDQEQQQDDDQNGEDQGNEEDQNQDNFDIDTDNTDDGEGEGQEGEDQDNPESGDVDQTAPEDDEEASEESQNKKDQYDQLYKDLTPEERAYRNMVLKNEYKDLHTLCGSILMQTGYFPNVTETQPLMKRLIKSLQNFRTYIGFYLTDVYDTKSFYENKYQYEVYLQIFNGIKGIFSDLEKMMSHLDEDKESQDKK